MAAGLGESDRATLNLPARVTLRTLLKGIFFLEPGFIGGKDFVETSTNHLPPSKGLQSILQAPLWEELLLISSGVDQQ